MHWSRMSMHILISVYVDIGANPGDTATITFNIGANAFNRRWDIKVNQARLQGAVFNVILV